MGAQNVAKVFANWRHLGHREARALAFMANIALDADKPPVYFGGWMAVAEALGYDPENKRASSQEAFRQTIAKLSLEGAIVSSGRARLGVRAEYALTLDPHVSYATVDDSRPSSGRGVSWMTVSRESPNETLPQVPQRNIAPPPNETLGHVPQQTIGTSPNETLPPRRTEEPQGGTEEEPQGGTIPQSSHVTREPTRARENATLETERNRQLNALEYLIEKEKATS